jgi:hypothetical protein
MSLCICSHSYKASSSFVSLCVHTHTKSTAPLCHCIYSYLDIEYNSFMSLCICSHLDKEYNSFMSLCICSHLDIEYSFFMSLCICSHLDKEYSSFMSLFICPWVSVESIFAVSTNFSILTFFHLCKVYDCIAIRLFHIMISHNCEHICKCCTTFFVIDGEIEITKTWYNISETLKITIDCCSSMYIICFDKFNFQFLDIIKQHY